LILVPIFREGMTMVKRNGWVSNSSTTSFICITPEDSNPFDNFDGLIREALEEAFSFESKEILGILAKVYRHTSSDEGCYALIECSQMEELKKLPEFENKEDWEIGEELWNRFTNVLSKTKGFTYMEEYR